jgi:serine/threonine-protein kinase
MSLSAGDKLGPYEILSLLGAGGMGEVWKARDSRLGRTIAIKVSKEQFSKRFEREARAVAALNHPNICTLHDVGPNYLVMELVEGRTLADRISEGAVPLEEALAIAAQIAGALEAAHEKGIVHRDLKPANVKITPKGVVKVLDFGLASALREPAQEDSEVTLTFQETRDGSILGTPAYMSPEQARGRPADKRADIWAFGVVLYEMLTGKRPFKGPTLSDTLAAVLTKDPAWDRIPEKAQRLLRWCLEKDAQKRLRDIGDARLALEDTPPSAAPAGPRRSLPWAVAAACALLAATAVWAPWRAVRPAPGVPPMRLSVDLGPGAIAGTMTTAAISPDGTRLVFPWREPDGRQLLATRLLDQPRITVLPGTEEGADPFFSPDGRWIGFYTSSRLKKISVQGGAPVTLAAALNPRGATWDEDGTIIAALTNRTSLTRVPADGGTPQPLTQLEPGEPTHRWPQILPGGGAVLFTARTPTLNNFENASIDVVSLKNGQRKTLWRGGYFGRYLPTSGRRGHLVYLREGALFGVPFDPERLEIEGTPARLLEDVASDASSGGGQFDFSRAGTLVYLSGTGARNWPVVWLENSGRTQPLVPQPGLYYSPRFSPDGRVLALAVDEGRGSDIFLYDLQLHTMRRLTFTSGLNVEPVWTPDGKYVVCRSVTPSVALWWMRADGAGEPQRLMDSQVEIQPYSFSRDGRRLAYQTMSAETRFDLWVLPLDLTDPDRPKPGKPELLLGTPASERHAAFSPDGRWLAYVSDQSGIPEIYVRPEPGGRGQWQVSVGGGSLPIWSRNGRELFYLTADNRIMVAAYETKGGSFLAGKPRLWSPVQLLAPGFVNLDLAPDGKRFAVFLRPEAQIEEKRTVHVTFLLNFFDDVRRRLPGGR